MHHIHEFISMLFVWEDNIQLKEFFQKQKLQIDTVIISPEVTYTLMKYPRAKH